MPAAVAIPLITAGVSAGASLAGAKMASGGANRAARAQAQAANYAADVQGRSTSEALDFQKQQAALEMQRAEADRRANYDQWLAREQRLGSLGQMVGLGSRNIPGYVPSLPTAPNATSTMPGRPATSGAMPTVNAATGPIRPQLEAFFQSRGVPLTEVPYWEEKWAGLEQRGKDIKNPNYANERLSMAEILGGPRYNPGGAPRPAVGSLGQMAAAPSVTPAPLTAPIQVASTAYRPPSRLRDYLRSA